MPTFEYHSHVRLRFELAAGLGKPWTWDGGIPQGCTLSMKFIVALFLLWCRYVGSKDGVQPHLYADNLKCVSRDPGVLLRAARISAGCVRLVGQEPAPCKCVLMSTTKAVPWDMRIWIVHDDGHKSAKLDVRDLGEGEGRGGAGGEGAFGHQLSGLVKYPGVWSVVGHCKIGAHFCSPAGFS